jgi:hypothetical protein
MPWRNPLPSTSDLANQAVYVWSRIDPRRNRLIRDKFFLTTQDARREVEKESSRIFLANRANVNRTGVDFEILRMWAHKIDSVAEKHYEILCHHWKLLGERKTGAFVRACSAILARTIKSLGGSEAHKARMVHHRRGHVGQSLEESYKKSAEAIANRWQTKLDIEARELDLAESVARAKKKIDLDEVAHVAYIEFAKQDRTRRRDTTVDDPSKETQREAVIKKVRNPHIYNVLSIPEAALYFDVQPRSIYRWSREGDLRAGARRGSIAIESILKLERRRSRKRREC